MKKISTFLIIALLGFLSASCSREVVSLHSAARLNTASALEYKTVSVQAQNVHPAAPIEEPVALKAKPESVIQNCPDGLKDASVSKIACTSHKTRENEVGAVKTFVSKQVNGLAVLHKYVSERDYPQINKAGFIFIAAAILGFFLHLILVACIIIGVIGLIVLLSPLFHRRY